MSEQLKNTFKFQADKKESIMTHHMERGFQPEPSPRDVKFRGISNAVRRAITRGQIEGEITAEEVRGFLAGEKTGAPDEVIEKSLRYLSKKKEIAEVSGRYYTRNSLPGAKKNEVMVTGDLIKTEIVDGKLHVTVAAICFEDR